MSTDERIPTNLRTLLILEIMGHAKEPMTPTEINRQLDLPKQTVHRLCATLENEGFLKREPGSKRLVPAPRAKELAAGILLGAREEIARHQVLVETAGKVNETVNLVIPENDGMMYLDRVETDWAFRIQLPVGSHVPFHCTASGKSYMSCMPPAERRRFVDRLNLQGLTPNTHTNADTLLAELDVAAKRGFSVDNQEFIDGMVALSVPVKDKNDRYCASLAFHGPVQRLSIDLAITHKQVLLEGAASLRETFFS